MVRPADQERRHREAVCGSQLFRAGGRPHPGVHSGGPQPCLEGRGSRENTGRGGADKAGWAGVGLADMGDSSRPWGRGTALSVHAWLLGDSGWGQWSWVWEPRRGGGAGFGSLFLWERCTWRRVIYRFSELASLGRGSLQGQQDPKWQSMINVSPAVIVLEHAAHLPASWVSKTRPQPWEKIYSSRTETPIRS